MTPSSTPRRPPVFGPEPWSSVGGRTWSHWDLWFCAVTVADHAGTLDRLEQQLVTELRDRTGGGREAAESKLSHLVELRARLADVGLDAAGLATPAVLGGKGLLARARNKVGQRWFEGRAMSAAMIETPRVRLIRRARTGHWDTFPVDPGQYYASFRRHVEVKAHISKQRSFAVVDRLEERLRALDETGLSDAERLALYRAFHTAGLELADRADDSYGNVGDMRSSAWHTYLRIDWQVAGMRPDHYWSDLCGLTIFEDHALGHDRQTLPWSRIPRGQADLVESLLVDLERECRAGHLDHFAAMALRQLAWVALAGRRFSRYVDAARQLGTDHWQEVEALAESALRSGRPALAVDVFRAADRPGWHQEHLRRRCRALTGVSVGDHQRGRHELRVV